MSPCDSSSQRKLKLRQSAQSELWTQAAAGLDRDCVAARRPEYVLLSATTSASRAAFRCCRARERLGLARLLLRVLLGDAAGSQRYLHADTAHVAQVAAHDDQLAEQGLL